MFKLLKTTFHWRKSFKIICLLDETRSSSRIKFLYISYWTQIEFNGVLIDSRFFEWTFFCPTGRIIKSVRFPLQLRVIFKWASGLETFRMCPRSNKSLKRHTKHSYRYFPISTIIKTSNRPETFPLCPINHYENCSRLSDEY